MDNLLRPGKWQKITFTKPLGHEIYKLADGVVNRQLVTIMSDVPKLEKIYWHVGSTPDYLESVTIFMPDWLACLAVGEILTPFIRTVEDVPESNFYI